MSGLRVIRRHSPYTRALCPRYKRSNAFMSPRRAAVTKRASDMDSRSMLTTEPLPCTLDSKIRLDGSTALVRIGCDRKVKGLKGRAKVTGLARRPFGGEPYGRQAACTRAAD